jgi:Lectin C-type domain
MARRAWLLSGLPLLLLGVSACPVTDDYYIEEPSGSGVAGAALADHTTFTGGSSSGRGGTTGGSGGHAGAPLPSGGAVDAVGGAGGAVCVPSTERCNGHDDDCDEVVDELACNSSASGTVGCSGFVLPKDATRGYMLCINAKDYSHARDACAAQNMHLAWLDTSAENGEISKKVAALSNDAEVSFGANDIDNEGHWFWDGGPQFWNGDENGQPVAGLFNAWTDGTPNDENNDEDCAVLMSATASWGDRSCTAKYAYLCEEGAP